MHSTTSELELNQDILDLQRQRQLFDGPSRPESLWITCSDQRMDRIVERITEAEPALVLRRPFNRLSAYTPSQCEQMSAVDFAVDSLGVTNITICGHSAYDGIRQTLATPLPTPRRNGTHPHHSFSGLLQRVTEHQTLFAQARQNVIDQLAIVAAYPNLARRLQEGRLALYGLLLTDSGIFLRYDDGTGEFVALGQPNHAAM